MLPPAVHQRRNRSAIQIVQPAAIKDKPTIREIRNHRGKIQLAVEPWFNGVVIRRGDIGNSLSWIF
jgi:hypothetical protein